MLEKIDIRKLFGDFTPDGFVRVEPPRSGQGDIIVAWPLHHNLERALVLTFPH
jgi:hypothetical protein